MILLDTHTLIWLDAGNEKLGAKSRKKIDTALSEDELAVSAISFWEAATLVNKGRLKISQDLQQWRTELLSAGLREIPITGTCGIQAAGLPDFHGDPADRLIVATAIGENARLCTADQSILDWNGPLRCDDAHQ